MLEEYNGIKLIDEKIWEGSIDEKTNLRDELKKIQSELQSKYIELHSKKKLTKFKKIQLDEELFKVKERLKKLSKPDKENQNDDLFEDDKESKELFEKIKTLREEFFIVSERKKKDELKKKIEDIEWKFIEASLKEQKKESELKELKKIIRSNRKPYFLWHFNFGEVFNEKGGFDVVIGNPPYVRIHKQEEINKQFFKNIYFSAFKDYDIYVLFFEKALNILRENGNVVLITPDKYLVREYGEKIRTLLLRNSILELFDISRASDAFEAATYPLISIIKKNPENEFINVKFAKSIVNLTKDYDEMSIDQKICKEKNKIELIHPKYQKLIHKIYDKSKNLSDIITNDQMFCGTPRARDYYTWAKGISSKESKSDLKVLVCSNLSPYHIDYGKKIRTVGLNISSPRFSNSKKIISEKRWSDFVFKPKILIRGNDTRISAVLDNEGSVFIGIYGIKCDKEISSNYMTLLGLLNSNLFQWLFFIQNPSIKIAGGFFSINAPHLLKLPIKEDKLYSRQITILVKQILTLTKASDFLESKTKKANVKSIENQIDIFVYKLYELDYDEVKVVDPEFWMSEREYVKFSLEK
ncbi:MAG: Eco57I restriction-modification methylase domain-containing protein [Bacteroidetes bacterium]|nr:Eco57I restriction-modification methylase domain-containing protein [Bacteroidota bacterium]